MIQDVSNGVYARPVYRDSSWFVGFRFEEPCGLGMKYVHMLDLSKTTTDIRYAWIGNAIQARRIKKLHPYIRRMNLVRNALVKPAIRA